MSPLDDELRRTLTTRVADFDDYVSTFAAVETRATTMRRRRTAVAAVGAAGAVALLVGSVVWVTDSPRDTVSVPLDTPSATPTATESPLKTPDPDIPDAMYLDWPYRSGADSANIDVAQHTLWAGHLDDGTLVVVAQAVDAHGEMRSIAYVTPTDAASYDLEGAAINRKTTQEISFVLPGDAVPWVLVIGAPTTGQIQYAPDGSSFEAVTTTDGWALFKRTMTTASPPEAPPPPDQIRVLDGNGDIDHPLYQGPIDTGPSNPDK